jgi:hypothetical protein
MLITKLRSTLSICIVVICLIVFLADAQDSTTSCSTSSAFYDYDVSSLAGQNFSISYDTGDNTSLPIYFTICSAYNYTGCPEGSPICITTGSGVDSGGMLDTQELVISNGGDAIQLFYRSGSPCSYMSVWETLISIQCGSGSLGEGTTQVLVANNLDCTLNITMVSPAACPVLKKWVLPVFVICIFIGVMFVLYLLVVFFRRLNRPRTPTGITPASPEEVLHLLSPRPSSPSLFINDYIFTKGEEGSSLSPALGKKFLLDPPSPELATTRLPNENLETNTNVDPEKGMCKICWAQPVDCALVDCGHMLCVNCAANVMNCPFCRRKVITRVKLYYS